MAKPRMNSPVRVKNATGINRAYNGHLGIVYDIVPEGRHTYYKVRLNNRKEIVLLQNELEVLRNT
ncbi:hypothetical protein SEA_MOAB_153 [Streptomyces phage Moab]|nr:hypothetical protein SEA_MOAB_153 [Streptomyces phage Moab]